MQIHFDADEGRFIEIGCRTCQATVRAQFEVAVPRRMYVAALSCPGCGEQLVCFDVLSQVAFDQDILIGVSGSRSSNHETKE